MKRWNHAPRPLLGFVLGLLLFPTDCYRVAQVAVVNPTNDTVTVRLDIARPDSSNRRMGCDGFYRPPLAIAPDTADLGYRSDAWRVVDTASVRVPGQEYRLEMHLPPHMAAHVDQLVEDRWRCVEALEVERRGGIDRLVGDDILKALKKRSRDLLVYEVRS